MKKIILSFFVFSAVTALAQDSLFTIKGNFSKVKTGTVYLTVYGEAGAKKRQYYYRERGI